MTQKWWHQHGAIYLLPLIAPVSHRERRQINDLFRVAKYNRIFQLNGLTGTGTSSARFYKLEIYRLPTNNIELLRVPPGTLLCCAIPPGMAVFLHALVPLPPGGGYNIIAHQGILAGYHARRDAFFVFLYWRPRCREPPCLRFFLFQNLKRNGGSVCTSIKLNLDVDSSRHVSVARQVF